jgi:P-type Cu+ transporter
MTCAACAARVEKTLNAIDSVRATVNFATERATVSAPASIPVGLLIDAVEQAGYNAEVLTRGVGEEGGSATPEGGPRHLPAEQADRGAGVLHPAQ